MSHISRADAEILATFVRRLRPPAGHEGHWNQAGTIAAIQACKAPLSETAVALIRLAEDATVRTPGLLNQEGHWWLRAARGEQPSTSTPKPGLVCPLHPQHPMGTENCPECQQEAGPPLTPEQRVERAAQIKADIEKAIRDSATERHAIHERQKEANQ